MEPRVSPPNGISIGSAILSHGTSPPNHRFMRKIQHFYGKDTDKKYLLECTKTLYLSEKN